ncbi:MAG: YHYH protein [Verrucomicrobiota bacterium]
MKATAPLLGVLLVAGTSPVCADHPELPDNVTIEVRGDKRIIKSDGLPTYNPGTYPRRGNPNPISAQDYTFEVPAKPRKTRGDSIPAIGQPFGVTLDGLPLDPGAAEFWNGDREWQYEPMAGSINLGLDDNNAHVQPTGAYHYHAMPHGLLDHLSGGEKKMTQLGWAADGFPIYGPWVYEVADDPESKIIEATASYRVKEGRRDGGPGGRHDGTFVADYEFVESAGILDENNGREGVTPEFPDGTYYYVITEDFPFIPRSYAGEPDPSFQRRHYMGGRGGERPPRGGPPGGGIRPPDFEGKGGKGGKGKGGKGKGKGGPPSGPPPGSPRGGDPLDFLRYLD